MSGNRTPVLRAGRSEHRVRHRAGSVATLLTLALGLSLTPGTAGAATPAGTKPLDVAASARAGDAKNVKAARDAAQEKNGGPTAAGNAAGRPRALVAAAAAQAGRTRKNVPVPELTDEFSTTSVTPAGRLRTEQHTDLQRVRKAGAWRTPDARLTRRADGTYAPAAALDGLVLSGGGKGPLATMTTRDGKQLSVGSPFPGALPKPVVSGAGVLFKNVAKDTDLKVTATETGGFTTIVVLNSRAAAANPLVRRLSFPTDAKGVVLTADKAGVLRARSGKETVFTAPAPRMWSAAAPAGSRPYTGERSAAALAAAVKGAKSATGPAWRSTAEGPAPGAATAALGVRTSTALARTTGPRRSGAVTLTPSSALLDAESTVYPVYIDPNWSNDGRGKSHHAWVQQAYNNGNFDRTGKNDTDRPGMGYQGWETKKGIERTLFEFNLWGYAGAHVNSANLRVSQYISSDHSCTQTYPVNLYRADAFDSGLNWGNHRTREWVDGKWVPGNGTLSQCYSDIPIDFNITAPLRNALGDTNTPLAFALVGAEGTGDKMGFKRFSYDATLTSEYDFPPNRPENTHLTPTPRRVNGGGGDACWDAPLGSYGWVTDSRATFTSKVSSPNQGQLTEYLTLWDNANGGAVRVNDWSGFVGNGQEASYQVGYGTLEDGHYYGWQTQGDDGLLRGPGGDVCHFAVDLTPPVFGFGNFTDPATQFPPSGNGQTTDLRLGMTGSIPIAAYDPNPSGKLASGLACVRWSFDPQFATYDQQCGGALSKNEITVTPTHWGTNTLYAKAFDEAGLSSQTAAYSFYVPWAPGPVAFGDTTGDARPDLLVPDEAGNLVTHGRATEAGNPSVPATGTAALAGQVPDEGKTWKDYRVSHRGALDPGLNTDDLFVHRDGANGSGGKALHYYANQLSAPGRFSLATKATLARTNCTGGAAACPGFHPGTGSAWQWTSQITPIGSALDTRTPDRDVTGATGFLAVEADNLWYYPANTNGTLAAPNLVAQGGWDNVDLMVPGNTLDLNAAAATAPALWIRARTDANGRSFGDVFQYRLTATAPTDGTPPRITGATASPATRIGWGFTTSRQVGSDGDLTGDDVPDLWGVTDNGQILVFPSVAENGAVTGFGGARFNGTTRAAAAHWPLAGTADANPATQKGTESGVAWVTDTVDGRPGTTVASFAGNGAITTPAPAADPHDSFTVSVWANVHRSGSVVISQDNNRASSWSLYGEDAGWRFGIARADDDTWPYDLTWTSGPANVFRKDTWTQLTASYDAPTGQMNLYVDGRLASTGYHKASDTPAVSGGVVIGRYKYQGATSGPGVGQLEGKVSNAAVFAGSVAPQVTGEIQYAAADRCLDLPNGDAAAGVQLFPCNRTAAQQFTINPDGTITAGGRCLDVGGAATANGSGVGMWYCNGGGNQQWLPRADGSILNPASGRCLDIAQADAGIGTRPQLWDCNGTPAQRWSAAGYQSPVLPIVNP
ncbi:ricin-type beta-trefoil lectin domain protein [Streptomyces sp. NPDC089919]|uniref:ricin-type beta-trefoil lectin domain protein n=1 Tax=Streptomyces sp. NPDC089919 TaxID=3155188 RepID=UPI00343E3997